VAWAAWMGSCAASHWTRGDVPSMRVVVHLHDQVERGEYRYAGELRLWMDNLGLSPKGRQDRRWLEPASDPTPDVMPTTVAEPDPRFVRLRSASEPGP